jgi:hypothetical protein
MGLLVIPEKNGCRAFQQPADRLGPQVLQALLGVVQASQAPPLTVLPARSPSRHSASRLRHEAEPRRIFQVDDEVAGVISHLDQESQWMTPPCRAGQTFDQAGGAGDTGKVLGILLEEAEFLAALAPSSPSTCDGPRDIW